jgi:hypothetical protein
MPFNAFRSDTRGRPPFACDGGGGSNGSTTAHNSSDTSACILPHPVSCTLPSAHQSFPY